ncbi:NAD(P)-dependent methylenetetrahydromethanopterin dehydrogenase [Candidatus Methylobacter oryzae]|uniref:Methylenetetrahydromethanopterin dehydrogenase n=1 Tax=Candidatus Methylobacter oryzae TaxID=2497749 RepID=A0ABY3C9R4_9GAMM|nr:NAD(P)-dependent methylenetetrahydromethanopterin dehydrogenase [Candidatus Methylobacter oryzae]TRW94448.1 methylenetetrahydromethanopterin dehydrogenase [Candidatus Methylobacter oryzae]
MTKRILYFLTPGENISPFDVTLAADAGFDIVVPLTKIEAKNTAAVVQDAIFCRPPKRFNDTGIFIGGRDVHMATDMFQSAKKAMVEPFEVGVFADPNGAYTTSASVVALVAKVLKEHHNMDLNGRNVAVFGTGPVGICTAILAAKQGANVKLCQLLADDDKREALNFCQRYEANVEWVSAQTNEEKTNEVADSEVIICAARAGVRILEGSLKNAHNLLAAADTNAVPPSGILGIGLHDLGAEVEYANGSFRSVGPLAIGNLKYKVQFGLFEQIQKSSKAALIDFPEAYEFALSLLEKQA